MAQEALDLVWTKVDRMTTGPQLGSVRLLWDSYQETNLKTSWLTYIMLRVCFKRIGTTDSSYCMWGQGPGAGRKQFSMCPMFMKEDAQITVNLWEHGPPRPQFNNSNGDTNDP